MSQPSALTAASSAEARIPEILRLLHQEYPDATCELDFRSPLELLVATILSAQCTDERVNKVTPALFAAYPTAQAYAEADIEEPQEAVRPTGFFRNKSKNIQGAARHIVEAYDGAVLSVMDDLLTLPGVARKTANVVLRLRLPYRRRRGGRHTHVKRLSNRLGLTAESNPEKIERDLMNLVPPKKSGSTSAIC